MWAKIITDLAIIFFSSDGYFLYKFSGDVVMQVYVVLTTSI